ncbi:fimbria/pilus outer membrane usher protein [Rhodanobacter glycinis]
MMAAAGATAAGAADAAPVASPASSGADSASSSADAGPANGSDADGSTTFTFDRSLLAGAGDNTSDLARFEHGNPVLPGSYNVDIYLNNGWVGRRDVRFASATPNASATPCVDRQLLDQLGLHPANLSAELVKQLVDPAACVSMGSLIPDASMSFDMGNLRLDTSVPQAYMQQRARGYVSPEYWDEGVPAALLNYNFNSYRSSSHGQTQTTSYLGLNAGINLGAWHFRQDSTVNWQSATSGTRARKRWQNIDSYVRRDLPSLGAQLTLGDSYTDGQVFDSFGIRGVQLATDDRMLPDSLRGYAPVVRGVANTNAKVTVSQNGVQLYQTTVAPGPFVINDLYPTGYGGNLDVTVTEADGHTHTFSVPYASVAQLLRPGTTRFDVAVGQLRNTALLSLPNVVQATVQHGFNNLLTGYAGIEGSQGYAALLLGSAINTRYGAFALDVTQARTATPGYDNYNGHSMRLSYSKILPDTQTSLTVAAYRYSTSGFLSLTDAALARDYARRGLNAFSYTAPTDVTLIDGVPLQTGLTPAQQAALAGHSYNPIINPTGLQRQRNRFDLTMNQRLGMRGGSLYANVSASDYWNRTGTDTQFQVGYNNSFHRLNYGISVTRTRDVFGRYDNEYLATFSLPLGNSAHAPSLMLNLTHDRNGGNQDQAILNGSFGAENQFNYGATVAHNSGNDAGGSSGSVNLGYRSPYAVLNASAGSGNGYSQASFGLSGAIVAHPGGITFGQPIGDTVGIVYAPGAAGARLNNATGARIDHSGYAIVPYLTPYTLNTIEIDPKGLPLNVQMDATSAQVAPYAGAVVMLKFKTETGRTLIVRARLANGDALPFGAQVFNAKGTPLGVVGQAGQALLRGVQQTGQVSARWNDENGVAQACSFTYALPRHDKAAYPQIQATCVASSATPSLPKKSGT